MTTEGAWARPEMVAAAVAPRFPLGHGVGALPPRPHASQRRWHPGSAGDAARGLSQPGGHRRAEAPVAISLVAFLPQACTGPGPVCPQPCPCVPSRVPVSLAVSPRPGVPREGGRASVCLSYAFLWTGTGGRQGALVLHIL